MAEADELQEVFAHLESQLESMGIIGDADGFAGFSAALGRGTIIGAAIAKRPDDDYHLLGLGDGGTVYHLAHSPNKQAIEDLEELLAQVAAIVMSEVDSPEGLEGSDGFPC
jgi:hypothetical protein